MIMDNQYFLRIERLRQLMRNKGWDAVIITGTDPHNSEYPAEHWKQVEWLTGFAAEAADVVITLDHAGLWTDSRYFLQAEMSLKDTGVELHKMRISGAISIPEWLSEYAFSDASSRVVIAFDGLCTMASFITEIQSAFDKRSSENEESSVTIINCPDLLDCLWDNRPALPQSTIITLGTDTVGESREDKITWLRSFLADNNYHTILLTALDEIAWLLNVRGTDVEYNPVLISFLTVSLDSINWYIRKTGTATFDDESIDSIMELKASGVNILPYDDIYIDIGGFSEDKPGKIFADKTSLNMNLYNILSGTGLLCLGKSPVALKKAIKNSVEIRGMKEAHIEDGLAMERFLYWLEKQIDISAGITERDAADKIGELRANIDGYRGDSFETISAYGANAALPHYVTPRFNAPLLRGHGLYLCDSGGQYLFGTTDITRTIPLGPCTSLEKEDYTLVLKGHIELAMAVFPKGTAGCHLDILAREPLWRAKRNFGHGTGHGVGFFLNVHEGPQDIRQNFNEQPILPGMIVSDEPGIYRNGQHGIRHENLLLCKEAGRNDFGDWLCFEVLTLCHIDTSIIVKDLLTKKEIDWLNNYNQRVFSILSPYLPDSIALWLKNKTRTI